MPATSVILGAEFFNALGNFFLGGTVAESIRNVKFGQKVCSGYDYLVLQKSLTS